MLISCVRYVVFLVLKAVKLKAIPVPKVKKHISLLLVFIFKKYKIYLLLFCCPKLGELNG